jgi:hypothetical protein
VDLLPVLDLYSFYYLVGIQTYPNELGTNHQERVSDYLPSSGILPSLLRFAELRIILFALKLTLGFILLSNLNPEPIFVESGLGNFPVSGVLIPFNFSCYLNSSLYPPPFKRYQVLLTLGSTYEGKTHMWSDTPILQSAAGSDCSKPVCNMNLLRRFPFDREMLGAVDASDQDLITLYGAPFYRVEIRRTNWKRRANGDGCRYYGCGLQTLIICAVNNETEAGSGLELCRYIPF